MIVWINGGFGSGKSTLTQQLTARRPDAIVFDPEYVGYMLRQFVPVPTGDFQDLASWREIVAASVLSVHRHHAELLIVAMTLVNERYYREIIGHVRQEQTELLHVFLDVPADELRRRIEQRVESGDAEQDAKARAFAIDKIDECVTAAGRQDSQTLVLDAARLTPAQLADAVLDAIPPAG